MRCTGIVELWSPALRISLGAWRCGSPRAPRQIPYPPIRPICCSVPKRPCCVRSARKHLRSSWPPGLQTGTPIGELADLWYHSLVVAQRCTLDLAEVLKSWKNAIARAMIEIDNCLGGQKILAGEATNYSPVAKVSNLYR